MNKTKKIILFFLLFLLLCFAVLFIFRKPVASYLWENYHTETMSAVVLAPYDSDLAFRIAEYYFNHGAYDIEKAEKYYKKAISLDQSFLEAHYQLGRIFFINGEFSLALQEIATVLSINPEFKKAYYMYGLVNGYMGNFDQAIYGFSEFIKRDSFNWAGYNDLAWIYFRHGDYKKTKEIAELGLSQAPNNPWLNNIYGVALMNLGEKEKAKEALQIALRESEKLAPEDWGRAYPGNNPAIYNQGFEETKSTIRHNLSLLDR